MKSSQPSHFWTSPSNSFVSQSAFQAIPGSKTDVHNDYRKKVKFKICFLQILIQPKSTPRRPPRRSQTATLPRRNINSGTSETNIADLRQISKIRYNYWIFETSIGDDNQNMEFALKCSFTIGMKQGKINVDITKGSTQGHQNFRDKSLLDDDEGEKFLQTEVILTQVIIIGVNIMI